VSTWGRNGVSGFLWIRVVAVRLMLEAPMNPEILARRVSDRLLNNVVNPNRIFKIIPRGKVLQWRLEDQAIATLGQAVVGHGDDGAAA